MVKYAQASRSIGTDKAQILLTILEAKLLQLEIPDLEIGRLREPRDELADNLARALTPQTPQFSTSFYYRVPVVNSSKDGTCSYGFLEFGRVVNNDPATHYRSTKEVPSSQENLIDIRRVEELIRRGENVLKAMESSRSPYSILLVLGSRKITKAKQIYVACRPILITPWADEPTIQTWERENTTYGKEVGEELGKTIVTRTRIIGKREYEAAA